MKVAGKPVTIKMRIGWDDESIVAVEFAKAMEEARRIAGLVTGALGGRGIFGVELFIKGEDVIFSEVSPRPSSGSERAKLPNNIITEDNTYV